MQLTGHANPRGSEQFTFALGRRRAQGVKLAMLSLGLPARQIETVSRGKLDATGENEAEWARDQRVEATLVQ
jgi:peptidoglycan-associated lipoprotein